MGSMDIITTLKHAIDPKLLLEQFGYIGLFLVVFAESGLLIGFFLPGDSLLIIAGVLAAAGALKISILIPLIFIAAVAGDQIGYFLGNKFGRKLFKRFKKEHIEKSEEFFAQHGKRTIILARFVPVVRAFVPVIAGISNMPYRTYLTYDLIGGVVWGIGITLVGYGLGNIPNVDKYLHLVIGVIILGSLIPVLNHLRPKKTK